MLVTYVAYKTVSSVKVVDFEPGFFFYQPKILSSKKTLLTKIYWTKWELKKFEVFICCVAVRRVHIDGRRVQIVGGPRRSSAGSRGHHHSRNSGG